MPTLETLPSGYALWYYIPCLPASIIFIVLFIIMTGIHFALTIQRRAWYCIPFVVGGSFEMIGYIGRALAYDQTGVLGPFVIQSTSILIGPVLLAATIYMLLGRVVMRTDGEKYIPIPAHLLTLVFVMFDYVSFSLQGAGAGMMVSAKLANIGNALVLVGLATQVVGFAIFILIGGLFFARVRAAPTPAARNHDKWVSTVRVLFVVSGLILVRNVFRVIEYAMGSSGYLLRHEWTLYVFDTQLMFLAMVVFAWHHPGRVIEKASAPQMLEMEHKGHRNEHQSKI